MSLLISDEIHKMVDEKDTVEVEDLQDMVEFSLMASPRKDVAKRYIIYRNEQDKTRVRRKIRIDYSQMTSSVSISIQILQ